MRKHNAIKVLLVTVLVIAILTWILPAAYYQSSLVEQGRTQMGLFDLFNYPLTAVSYFGYIAIFVLAVGGFYGVLHKIPAYRNMLDKIVYNLRGNEKLFLVVTIVVFALLTSACGVQLALFIFFPFIASVILLLGYDKMVVALTLVGSTMIGMMGTTTAVSNVSVLFQSLSKVKVGSSMSLKIALLLIGLFLLILNVLLYVKKHSIVGASVAAKKTISTNRRDSKKVVVQKTTAAKKTGGNNARKSNSTNRNNQGKKNNKSKSRNNNKADLVDDDVIVINEKLVNGNNEFVPSVVDGTHKIWPLVFSMAVAFIVLLLAFIPWNEAFGLEVFDKATSGFIQCSVVTWIALLIGTILTVGLTFLISRKGKNTLVSFIACLLAVIIGYVVTGGSVTGFIILMVCLLVAHFVTKKLTGDILITSCVDLVVSILFVLIFAAATGFGAFFKGMGSFFTGSFPLFGKVFGNVPAFGAWTINELIPLLFVIALFLVCIYKVKFDDVLDGVRKGLRRALLPAAIVVLIYTILVIVVYHPFQLMIYKVILGWAKSFSLFGTTLIAIVSSVLNADPAYVFQSALPYFASIIKDASVYPKVALLFQSVYGITMLVAPTSLILMLVLSYLNVNYIDWLKNVWLFVVVLLVLTLLVLAFWNVIVAYVIFALIVILFIVLAIKKKI